MAKAKGVKEFEEIKLDPCDSSPTGFHHFILPDSTGGFFQEVGVCKHCGDNKVHGKWAVGYNNQPEEITKVRVVSTNVGVPRLEETTENFNEFNRTSIRTAELNEDGTRKSVDLTKTVNHSNELDSYFDEGKHIVPTYLSRHGDTDDIDDIQERLYS